MWVCFICRHCLSMRTLISIQIVSNSTFISSVGMSILVYLNLGKLSPRTDTPKCVSMTYYFKLKLLKKQSIPEEHSWLFFSVSLEARNESFLWVTFPASGGEGPPCCLRQNSGQRSPQRQILWLFLFTTLSPTLFRIFTNWPPQA